MSKVIRIGGLYDKEERHQAGSIYDQEGLSPNLDTCGGGNRQPLIANDPVLLGGINEMKSNNGRQYYQQDRIYDSEFVALCQSANESFNPWYQIEEGKRGDKTNLRIRKLTPKECWRPTNGIYR